MDFIKINLEKHREQVISFRRDSFVVSFGSDDSFGNDEDYLNWLQKKITEFPDGFVLLEEKGEWIGQVELSIREFEGKNIGYVHLYYLVPEKRGAGLGKVLNDYAMAFFKSHHVKQYHLRVSPTNKRAIAFYNKLGMTELKPEAGGKVIRMVGNVE